VFDRDDALVAATSVPGPPPAHGRRGDREIVPAVKGAAQAISGEPGSQLAARLTGGWPGR
jgi:DNA-binding IclR family transcriptional regulator